MFSKSDIKKIKHTIMDPRQMDINIYKHNNRFHDAHELALMIYLYFLETNSVKDNNWILSINFIIVLFLQIQVM